MKKIIILALIFLMTGSLSAGVMDSSNYSIERDSINFGGGLSDSPNYSQESTFGEVATGDADSTNFSLRAGYQQMDDFFITLNTTGDVTLSPAINGSTGGTANGSTVVTVVTDNTLGYELSVKSGSSPALTSGVNSFSDYTPAGLSPDFAFSISTIASAFAFSPEGADVVQRYLDDGASCDTGAGDTSDSCWDGLSTTDELIAESASANNPLGTDTTIKLRASSGSENNQPAGSYSATVTITAVAL